MPGDSEKPKEVDATTPFYGVPTKPAQTLYSGQYPLNSPVHSPRNEWLREDLKKIEERKLDQAIFNEREASNTSKFKIIEEKVESLKGCNRYEEFEDMKRAIDGWRTFFRNTVAVGAISGIVVVGGWLWQYYTLTKTVDDTSDVVKELTTELKSVKTEIQMHKEVSLENALDQQKELDSRFGQMEFRILSAVSSISRGQKLDQPSPDVYYQERKKQLIKQYGSWDKVPIDAAAGIKDEMKTLTKVNK